MDILEAAAPRENYLTRSGRNQDQRKFERRDCNIIVGILYPGKGLRKIRLGKIQLVNISEGGALANAKPSMIPNHFNLFFGIFQYFIGCSVVNRAGEKAGLKFVPEQPAEFINILSRISDPSTFLRKIRPPLYGLPTLPTAPTIQTEI